MDNEHLDRLEKKVDAILERVVKLETGRTLGNRLLGAIAGLLVALAAHFLGSCAPVSAVRAQAYQEELENRVAVSVLCVYPDNSGPGIFGASGVAVGPGVVVTARHAVDCEKWDKPNGKMLVDGEPWIVMVNGHEFVVAAEGSHRNDDAAVLVALRGERPFERYASMSSDPRVGEGVCAAPAMPFEMLSCGPVVSWGKGDRWDGNGFFRMKAFSTPGNSGSGVYDAGGRLVGILVGGNKTEATVYAVSRWRHLVPPVDPDLGF